MEIYLDNAATTKVSEEVAEKVKEVMISNYGNPSSLHFKGVLAREKLGESRKKIADFVGCNEGEIIFTSGGTESNNLALKGLAKANPNKRHIVTSVIEHKSILEVCRELEKDGYEVDYLEVDSEGLVSVEDVISKIRDDTLVVSVMSVNNEIGTIQLVEAIGKVCKERNVYFHTDAVQAFSKIDLDVSGIDLMSVSGHKFGAPKGVGFLYVKKGVKISSVIYGGGQENKMRSGTENVPGIIGLVAALEVDNQKDEILRSRNKILEELKKIPEVKINGSLEKRIWNNINVSFYGIEGESLMLMLSEEGICVSTGSACASTKLAESYVLKAIGVDEMYIHGSIRISLGEDVIGNEDFVIEKVKKVFNKLKEISPFKLNLEEVKNGEDN